MFKFQKETECNEQEKYFAEYSETLHTSSPSKMSKSKSPASWRDIEAIEKKVDKLHITRAKKPVTKVDKSVDRIIKKMNK